MNTGVDLCYISYVYVAWIWKRRCGPFLLKHTTLLYRNSWIFRNWIENNKKKAHRISFRFVHFGFRTRNIWLHFSRWPVYATDICGGRYLDEEFINILGLEWEILVFKLSWFDLGQFYRCRYMVPRPFSVRLSAPILQHSCWSWCGRIYRGPFPFYFR